MLTIFAIPKPFIGHINIIQRNAIMSWKHLEPQCEIILFGDEKGTADCAREFDVLHIPEVNRNEFGTPLVNNLFEKAQQISKQNILCFANSDIIFLNDILNAIKIIAAWRARFLIIGQCYNMDIFEEIDFSNSSWGKKLKTQMDEHGVLRGYWAIDFFIFSKSTYPEKIPPFALGRGYYDNWLVWKASSIKAPIIDITQSVRVIHQNHDYSHIKGGQEEAYYGGEAKRNVKLTGGLSHRKILLDATHFFSEKGIKRNLINKLSWTMIKVLKTRFYYYILDLTRDVRHRFGIRKRD